MTEQKTPLLEFQQVSKSFLLDSGSELKVLGDMNLYVYPNEAVALLGPSGSGKSTALRIMAGLMKPNKGQVLRRGENLKGVNADIAMVFQSYALYPNMTVAGNISFGLEMRRVPKAERDKAVAEAMRMVSVRIKSSMPSCITSVKAVRLKSLPIMPPF